MSFSLQALRQNPVRSFLTGLGMVIGTASVILVVTISLTSQNYILEQIEGVGSNMIFASYEVGVQQTSAEVNADFIKMADVRRSASNWAGVSWLPPGSPLTMIRFSSMVRKSA